MVTEEGIFDMDITKSGCWQFLTEVLKRVDTVWRVSQTPSTYTTCEWIYGIYLYSLLCITSAVFEKLHVKDLIVYENGIVDCPWLS